MMASNPKSEPSTQETLQHKVTRDNPKARRLMWVGILVFSVAICGIWGWSLKEQIASIKWSETPESKLITKTREDWNTLFKEQKIVEEKNNLKNAIHAVLARTNTSSTQTTSTTTTSTTATTSTNK